MLARGWRGILVAMVASTALAAGRSPAPMVLDHVAQGNRVAFAEPSGQWRITEWSRALDHVEYHWLSPSGAPALPSQVAGVTWRSGSPPPRSAPALSISRAVIVRAADDVDVLDALLPRGWIAPRGVEPEPVPIGDRTFTSREFELQGESGARRVLQLAWAQPHGHLLAEVLHVLLVADVRLPVEGFAHARTIVGRTTLARPFEQPTTASSRVAYLEDLATAWREAPSAVGSVDSPVRAFDLEMDGATIRGVGMDIDADGCVDAFTATEGTALALAAVGGRGTPVGQLRAIVVATTFFDQDLDGRLDSVVMGGGDMDGDGIVDSRILLEDADEDGVVDRGRHFTSDASSSVGSVQGFWGRIRVRRWTPQGTPESNWLPRESVLIRARATWDALRLHCAPPG